MKSSLRFLLLQARNPEDPMRRHEVEVFARILEVPAEQIDVVDLMTVSITTRRLAATDMVLLGGSGDYSAAGEGDWLERALDSLRSVHGSKTPTFASCWGFQALARAMGGFVVTDIERAEVGTLRLYLTDAGKIDPIFSPLSPSFLGQMGHQDHVIRLPPSATQLAYSDKVTYQAYRFRDAPIYCTQFHPELTRDDLLLRVENYPQYIEKIAGIPMAEFVETVRDTTPSEGILKRFVREHFSV